MHSQTEGSEVTRRISWQPQWNSTAEGYFKRTAHLSQHTVNLVLCLLGIVILVSFVYYPFGNSLCVWGSCQTNTTTTKRHCNLKQTFNNPALGCHNNIANSIQQNASDTHLISRGFVYSIYTCHHCTECHNICRVRSSVWVTHHVYIEANHRFWAFRLSPTTWKEMRQYLWNCFNQSNSPTELLICEPVTEICWIFTM